MNSNFNDFDIVTYNGTNYIIRISENPLDNTKTYNLYTLDGKLFMENPDLNLLTFFSSYDEYYQKINKENKKREESSHGSSSGGGTSSGKSYGNNRERTNENSKTESGANELSESIGTIDKTEETYKNCESSIQDAKNAISTANLTLNTWEDVKNSGGLATDASIAYLSNMIDSLETIEKNLENNLPASLALHRLNLSLKKIVIKYVDKKEKEKQRDLKQAEYDKEREYIEEIDSSGNKVQKHNPRKDTLKSELDTILKELDEINTEIDELQNEIDYQYGIIKEKYGNLVNLDSVIKPYNGNVFGTAGVRKSGGSKEVGMVPRYEFTHMEYKGLKYWLYLPEGVEESEDLPIMIYLHGMSEYGKEVASSGLGGQLKRKSFSFNPNAIIICPQVDDGWNPNNKGYAKLKDIADGLVEEYHADPNRISIAGHSAGAKHAMKMAAAYPDYFSAVVPVSEAEPDYLDVAGLENVKYWGLCGSNDKYLRHLEQSQQNGNVDFNLTILEGEGHDIENIVFNRDYDLNGETVNPLIWALSQSRAA